MSLFNREQEGNNEKLMRLYQRYRQRLYYVALGILKDPMEAEDAVQDAFLRIRNHLEKISEEEGHKTMSFLVIIVKHISIDRIRKRSRVKLCSLEDLETYLAKNNPVAEDSNDNFEQAFHQLSFDHAEILRLKYDLDLTNTDIAQILQISEVTVRKRLSRAREKLKVLMMEEDRQ